MPLDSEARWRPLSFGSQGRDTARMGRRATLERPVETEAADFDERPSHGLGLKVRVLAHHPAQRTWV
jgi:hypothetical protein